MYRTNNHLIVQFKIINAEDLCSLRGGGIRFYCLLGCLKLEEKVGAYVSLKVDITCFGYSKMKVPRDRSLFGTYFSEIRSLFGP